MKKNDQGNNIAAIPSALFKTLKLFVRERLLKKVKAKFLYLEVTHRCNLACISCYTNAGREKNDALTLNEQEAVVRQAREMGVRSVSLSGSGEPLMYEHLFDLIDYIQGLGMSVIIFTNGTLVDADIATRLVSRNVLTFFKLYSLEPNTFDSMVGCRNAYEWTDYHYLVDGYKRTQRIPHGLKVLLEAQQSAGFTGLVKLETLVTKINIRTIPDIARFCKQTGIGFFMETPVFRGKALQNYQHIAVSAAAYENLYRELVSILGEDYLLDLKNSPCSVEKNPVVWTDGRIGFCSSRAANIGNVRDEPLNRLFLKAKRYKRKEDRTVPSQAGCSRYFRTCPSRQLSELENHLPCDY